MSKNKKIIITTGGTGGHIFPARCLAKNLANNGFLVTIFADKNYPKYHKDSDKFKFSVIPSSQIKKSPLSLAIAAILIGSGVVKSLISILIKRPEAVIAFGGYSTFPTLISAVILRKKIILHEQNAHLGKVNRIFAKFATQIATSFKETDAIAKEFQAKTTYVGNPVRQEIIKLSQEEYTYPEFDKKYKSQNNLGYNLVLASDFEEIKKIKEDHFNILVIGGSGGAKIFSDILPKAFFNLRTDLKNKINIIQQCKTDSLDATFNQYQNFNLNVNLRAFFTDIEEQIKKAHLVIARSGSTSIAELAVAKKPMILVPFANSADNHQEKNAAAIADACGAIVIKEAELTINKVTDIVEKLIDNKEILQKMSRDAFAFANLNATEKLAELVTKISAR